MKKKICDLKPGTPFKYKGRVFLSMGSSEFISLTDGEQFDLFWGSDGQFESSRVIVTVCKQIKKSDIKERK